MKRILWVALVALTLVFSPVAEAQTLDSGQVKGTVFDETNAPIPGATVTLKNEVAGQGLHSKASLWFSNSWGPACSIFFSILGLSPEHDALIEVVTVVSLGPNVAHDAPTTRPTAKTATAFIIFILLHE